MNATPPPTPRHCGQCSQFERSKLDGYGYCKAGRTLLERARFLWRETVCLFTTEWSHSHA